jgi:exodeoxyribonuclease VII large subunit
MASGRSRPWPPEPRRRRRPRSDDLHARYARCQVTDTPSLLDDGAARDDDRASSLPGPYAVGDYASALRAKLRGFARVQLVGEIANLRPPSRARAYFELRDASGAIPCAMWRNDWDALGPLLERVCDGVQVIVSGGCDYYPGSTSASPAFSFSVETLRVAGEGDLLAQIEERRRRLAADGLLERQRELARPLLPLAIGVVCGESGKAREDVLAGLARRGWAGRVVWAFTPVQDRHAAPQIAQALRDLAACGQVEVIVVARGGGSLTDLLAFSDELLCRTVALLPVPVIASIGHHSDRTLLDEIAAVSCSTPTHAAEAAVPLHCLDGRRALREAALRLRGHSREAVVARARLLAALSRAPAAHVARQRATLHQSLRELRAASRRLIAEQRERTLRRTQTLERARARARGDCEKRLPAELERLRLALAAHDPQRTLARGYALVEEESGTPVTTAAAARAAGRVRVRFADDAVAARIEPS